MKFIYCVFRKTAIFALVVSLVILSGNFNIANAFIEYIPDPAIESPAVVPQTFASGIGGYFSINYNSDRDIRFIMLTVNYLEGATRNNIEVYSCSHCHEDGLRPVEIYWDGKNKDGRILGEGYYQYLFRVDYENQQFPDETRVSRGVFAVGSPDYTLESATWVDRPEIKLLPGDDGKGINFTFSYKSSESYGERFTFHQWMLTIFDENEGEELFRKVLEPHWFQDGEKVWCSCGLADLPKSLYWNTAEAKVLANKSDIVSARLQVFNNLDGISHYWFSSERFKIADITPYAAEPAPTPTPTITPTPIATPTQQPEDDGEVSSEVATTLHPVLLIHGLNSYPEMWKDAANNSDYFALLKKWGYPEDYLAAYTYTGTGVGINGYNNQGHIAEAALGMREAVLKLSEVSLAQGGDGKVDIVAHSMGGLIARQYIKGYLSDSMIGKVVAIGTPFQGSQIMGLYDDLGTIGRASFDVTFGNFIIAALGINPRNPAPQEMTPGSAFITSLNFNLENDISYFTIAGDIKINYQTFLFNLPLYSNTRNVGDGVVSYQSAVLVTPRHLATSYLLSDDNISNSVQLAFMRLDQGYSYVGSWERVVKSRFFHTMLPESSEVQARMLKILLEK